MWRDLSVADVQPKNKPFSVTESSGDWLFVTVGHDGVLVLPKPVPAMYADRMARRSERP